MSFINLRSNSRDITAALLFWLFAAILSLYLLTISQHQDRRATFSHHTSTFQSAIESNLHINSSILESISALTGPADLFQQENIRWTIERLIKPHPHIRSVLLFPTVDQDELRELLSTLQIDNLPGMAQKIDRREDLPPLLSPVVLNISKDEILQKMLGMDARAIDALSGTIEITTGGHHLSSLPHRIADRDYYFLVANAQRPLNIRDDNFPWYSTTHVALLIDPQMMIPEDSPLSFSLSMFNSASQHKRVLTATKPANLASWRMTTTLDSSSRLNSMSQPFLLETVGEIPLVSLSAQSMVLFGLFSLLYLLFITVTLRIKNHAKKAAERSERQLLLQTENRVQMLNSISHDIRTPLTRLQLRSSISGQEQCAKCLLDANEIGKLVEGSLEYLRDEQQQDVPEICNIGDLVKTIEREVAESGQTIKVSGDVRWPYMCQLLQLKRAIENLINNALQYGSEVSLNITDTEQQLIIEVSDSGPGIDEQLIDQVTQPYFRTDLSRSRDSCGVGLGLSIVNQFCESHDGTLTLKNRPEGGLLATIALPR